MIDIPVNKRIRVIENRAIHIKRSLLGKGKILVAVREEVKPDDILGQSIYSAGFMVVELAKRLGVSNDSAPKYLQRPVGKIIYKGELLAFKKDLLSKKVILAPTDSLIESYDQSSGKLRLTFVPKEKVLTAGVYGIVDYVDANSGEVYIKTVVNEVYGILGTGRLRSGILRFLDHQSDLVTPAQITEDLSQHVIVAGSLIYGEALKKAAGFGVSGMISGGLNVHDFKAMSSSIDPKVKVESDVGLSLVATEGFGPIPIGDDIFRILSRHEQKFVLINGNRSQIILPSGTQDSILALRKIALPLNGALDNKPEESQANLKLGDMVRVVWPPFMGLQGKVINIDQTVTRLESGVSTYMVTVETSQRKVKISSLNIEVL